MREVRFHGASGHEEALADLAVAESRHDVPHHLTLGLGQGLPALHDSRAGTGDAEGDVHAPVEDGPGGRWNLLVEDDPHQLMAEAEDPIDLSDDSRGHGLAEICEHLDYRSTHRGGQHLHLPWLTEHRRDDQEILAAIWKSRYPRHHHRMHRRRGLRGVG